MALSFSRERPLEGGFSRGGERSIEPIPGGGKPQLLLGEIQEVRRAGNRPKGKGVAVERERNVGKKRRMEGESVNNVSIARCVGSMREMTAKFHPHNVYSPRQLLVLST